jgi:cold shock CspA family protein
MDGHQRDGVVSAFDDDSGLGQVMATDGTIYPFQCTQITDGTRTIPEGAAVTFAVRAWHRGRYEAVAVTPR